MLVKLGESLPDLNPEKVGSLLRAILSPRVKKRTQLCKNDLQVLLKYRNTLFLFLISVFLRKRKTVNKNLLFHYHKSNVSVNTS